jgi:YHS domain-containing protein
MRLLRRIAKEENCSVVIVSQDQCIKDIADRILWLKDGEFKNVVEMAIDPVCGMSVDRASAPAQATYEGEAFYFCARGCRDEFLKLQSGILSCTTQAANGTNVTDDIVDRLAPDGAGDVDFQAHWPSPPNGGVIGASSCAVCSDCQMI